MRKRAAALVGTAALALPAAAGADTWQVRLAPADQASARAAVVRRADLGAVGGWRGGPVKPDTSDEPPCPGFRAKQSDLVLTGASASRWVHTGLVVFSSAHVLRTTRMVQLDWRRTALAPEIVPCLRRGGVKDVAPAKLISLRRVPSPRVGTNTFAVAGVIAITRSGKTLRLAFEEIVFTQGRTELELGTVAPLGASSAVRLAELKLARAMAARARA